MSCVPVGLLNWWVTFDQPIPVNVDDDATNNALDDIAAEDYVKGLFAVGFFEEFNRVQDWSREGVTAWETIEKVIEDNSDANGTIKTSRTAKHEIKAAVLSGKSVLAAVAILNGNAIVGWHCVMIAPATASQRAEDPTVRINILNYQWAASNPNSGSIPYAMDIEHFNSLMKGLIIGTTYFVSDDKRPVHLPEW